MRVNIQQQKNMTFDLTPLPRLYQRMKTTLLECRCTEDLVQVQLVAHEQGLGQIHEATLQLVIAETIDNEVLHSNLLDASRELVRIMDLK